MMPIAAQCRDVVRARSGDRHSGTVLDKAYGSSLWADYGRKRNPGDGKSLCISDQGLSSKHNLGDHTGVGAATIHDVSAAPTPRTRDMPSVSRCFCVASMRLTINAPLRKSGNHPIYLNPCQRRRIIMSRNLKTLMTDPVQSVGCRAAYE